jgi:hypothetical protein
LGHRARTFIFVQTKSNVLVWAAVNATVPIFVLEGGDHMKIIYPICCGVDVHKWTIVATRQNVAGHNAARAFVTGI